MVRLQCNANQKIKTLLDQRPVRNFHHLVCSGYARGSLRLFLIDLQTLITKVAVMMSEITDCRSISNCAEGLEFLCLEILGDYSLYDIWNDLALDEKANLIRLGDCPNSAVKTDMDMCVEAFNYMVTALSDKYSLPELNALIVKK